MKFKYTKKVTVTIEDELPILGYDLKHASRNLFGKEIDEAIRISVVDGRPKQTINFGGRNTYIVHIDDYITSVDDDNTPITE